MTKSKEAKAFNNINLENNIIDKYYKENYDENLINENLEAAKLLEDKLNTINNKMTLPLEEIELDVNILGQIAKGEEIKEKKRGRIESFLFVLASFFLITFVTLTSVLNPALIKYFIGVAVLSPIAVLPVTMDLLKGSDSYE